MFGGDGVDRRREYGYLRSDNVFVDKFGIAQNNVFILVDVGKQCFPGFSLCIGCINMNNQCDGLRGREVLYYGDKLRVVYDQYIPRDTFKLLGDLLVDFFIELPFSRMNIFG